MLLLEWVIGAAMYGFGAAALICATLQFGILAAALIFAGVLWLKRACHYLRGWYLHGDDACRWCPHIVGR